MLEPQEPGHGPRQVCRQLLASRMADCAAHTQLKAGFCQSCSCECNAVLHLCQRKKAFLQFHVTKGVLDMDQVGSK